MDLKHEEVPHRTRNKRLKKSRCVKIKKQKVITREHKIDLLWNKLVRKGVRHLEYERNVDLISVEESDSRIISFFIALALLVTIVTTILTIIFILAIDNSKAPFKYWETNTQETNLRNDEIIIPNLVIIYDNGTVVQASFGKSMNIVKMEKILQ